MKSLSKVALLLAGTAFAAPALAEAPADADAAGDRDYLPADIVVTGERVDGYNTDDGSTATKTPTPVIDVPQTIGFITEDQLEDQAITQLNDALRYVPGVSLDTGEGHRDQVYIRGQASTADFYLDGLRDDAQYYRSLYNVERIEILKGANALIFGRGGGGGVINRVSKKAKFDGTNASLSGAVDNFGAFNVTGDINAPFSPTIAGRIAATYEEFDSDRDFFQGRFFGVAPSITVALGASTNLYAQYSYADDKRVTDRGLPSLSDGDDDTVDGPLTGYDRTFFGDPDFNDATSQTHIARLRLEHAFTDTLTANVTGQFADYDKYYANVLPRGTDGTTVSLAGYASDTQRQNWIGQANLVWDASLGAVDNTLLLGLEFGDQDTVSARYGVDFATDPSAIALDRVIDVPAASLGDITRASDSQLSTFSAYVQDQIDFGIVQLIGGLRYDRFDLTSTDRQSLTTNTRVDETVSPRAGIVIKPQDALSLYASYSTSFLPQSGDQFTSLSDGDAVLDPEKFENFEVGVKYAVLPKLFATAALFRLDRSNTTAPSPENDGTVVLTGSSRVEGFEASLVGEVTDFWQANLGYTYLDGEIRTDTERASAGQRLHQLPEHQISLWNRFDLTERFGLGAGVVYQAQQLASISGNVALPDYWRVDAAAYYELSDQASVQLNIENLFDEDYYPSAHGDNNIQPGKPFTAKLGVRFQM